MHIRIAIDIQPQVIERLVQIRVYIMSKSRDEVARCIVEDVRLTNVFP